MYVLITGAGGFNGASLSRFLLENGHNVSAVIRNSTGQLPKEILRHQRFFQVHGDLAEGIDFPKNVEAVVHMAATSPAPGVSADDMINDNVKATSMLVRQSVEAGVRCFIYFSTLSVYGEINQPEVDEYTPIIDPDIYGKTKMTGEELVADQAASWRSLAIRLPAVIGPGAVRHWLTDVLAKAKKGEDISIFNGEQPFNNAVHVDDVCTMIIGLLGKYWEGHDAITIGADDSISVRAVVETIINAAESPSEIVECQSPKPSFTISNKNAINNYGYKPQSLEVMLRRFVMENP